MNRIYLVRHDAAKNMHRFYQMYVTPGIFDDWSLVREWGRVGSVRQAKLVVSCKVKVLAWNSKEGIHKA
ncbi:MAG: WGR domain-containing protein [Methylococcales bacterium]|nr:WGR domain-containing protein [Methylococcales bacterium]